MQLNFKYFIRAKTLGPFVIFITINDTMFYRYLIHFRIVRTYEKDLESAEKIEVSQLWCDIHYPDMNDEIRRMFGLSIT